MTSCRLAIKPHCLLLVLGCMFFCPDNTFFLLTHLLLYTEEWSDILPSQQKAKLSSCHLQLQVLLLLLHKKRDVNNCVVHNETATLSILLIKLHGTGIECRTPEYRDSKFRSGSKVSVVCELYIPPTAGRWFVPFDEPKLREVL